MKRKLGLVLLLGILGIESNLSFAKTIEFKVAANPNALAVTSEIFYLFHWADGSTSSGSLPVPEMMSRDIQLNDSDPALVGCESNYYFSNKILKSSVAPRDLNPLANKHVPCVKVSDLSYNLVPQFAARSVLIKMSP